MVEKVNGILGCQVLLSGAQCQDQRPWAQTETQEAPFKMKRKLSYSEENN